MRKREVLHRQWPVPLGQAGLDEVRSASLQHLPDLSFRKGFRGIHVLNRRLMSVAEVLDCRLQLRRVIGVDRLDVIPWSHEMLDGFDAFIR